MLVYADQARPLWHRSRFGQSVLAVPRVGRVCVCLVTRPGSVSNRWGPKRFSEVWFHVVFQQVSSISLAPEGGSIVPYEALNLGSGKEDLGGLGPKDTLQKEGHSY